MAHPAPKAFALDVRGVAHTQQPLIDSGIAPLLKFHKRVEPECYEYGQNYNYVELNIDGCATQVRHKPHHNHHKVGEDEAEGCADVRESHLDEQVVQMQLVGAEGRHSVNHTGRHHPECIENRNSQNRQSKRNQPDAFHHQDCAGGVGGQNRHHENRHNGTHKQGTAVADEHLRLAAEHVVEEEWNKSSLGCHGDNHHCLVAQLVEHHRKNHTGHCAEPR